MSEKTKNLKHFNPLSLWKKDPKKSLNKVNNYSSFWMGDSMDNHSSITITSV